MVTAQVRDCWLGVSSIGRESFPESEDDCHFRLLKESTTLQGEVEMDPRSRSDQLLQTSEKRHLQISTYCKNAQLRLLCLIH